MSNLSRGCFVAMVLVIMVCFCRQMDELRKHVEIAGRAIQSLNYRVDILTEEERSGK